MSKTISPNTTIAQYTIVSKIGEGGMGRFIALETPNSVVMSQSKFFKRH